MNFNFKAKEKERGMEVKIGQIWSDNDSRFGNSRRLKVLGKLPNGKWLVENCQSKLKTQIREDRFKPTSTGNMACLANLSPKFRQEGFRLNRRNYE